MNGILTTYYSAPSDAPLFHGVSTRSTSIVPEPGRTSPFPGLDSIRSIAPTFQVSSEDVTGARGYVPVEISVTHETEISLRSPTRTRKPARLRTTHAVMPSQLEVVLLNRTDNVDCPESFHRTVNMLKELC